MSGRPVPATVTISQASKLALQHHQAGRLADAEALYRQILAANPNHDEALHHLGLIAHQVGRHDLAVDLIRQAIALQPNSPAAHSNLGETYRTLRRLSEAIVHFRHALELNPGSPDAHFNLGAALAEQGQLSEAENCYRRAIHLRPDFADAQLNLGATLARQGRLNDAVAAYHRALELEPNSPEAQNNLAGTLAEQGLLDEAVGTYYRSLALRPDYPEARLGLGAALARQGQFNAAIADYRRALQLKPDYAEAWNNLGDALTKRGHLDEAIASLRRALQLRPEYAEASLNLGAALAEDGQIDEAAAACREALRLKPSSARAHLNLGNALTKQGKFDEAVLAYHRALHLDPDYAEARVNLGGPLIRQGRLDEAIAGFRRALESKPDCREAHSSLIYTLQYQPGSDAGTIAEAQRRWNQKFAEPLRCLIPPPTNDRNPGRRLRVGYVSPDLRDHVVGRNLVPLFKHHDHGQFEILCYAGVAKPDDFTEAFRRYADHWRSTVGVPDEALAAMIRQDGVDILVDLTQHTAGERLLVFARQPAPVQVSFAGYPAGTGLEAIPYRIGDRYLESEIGDGRWGIGPELRSPIFDLRTEQVLLLDSFWCYDSCGVELDVNELPARKSGRITFGSLNNFCKVNEPVLRLWARVLGAVRDSHLILRSPSGSHRKPTLEILAQAGVEAQRVEFVEPRPRRDYLELYHRLDIALDPFPYNGHTTSLDALWMGVPVVTLVGHGAVSRAGLSQLSNLGLAQLAAISEDDYIRIAAQLAADRPRLADLRSTLRSRMETSSLMDAPRFARQIEAAYRTLWQRWCAANQLQEP